MGNREIKYEVRSWTGFLTPGGPRLTRYFTPEAIKKNNARWRRMEKAKKNEVDKDTCHPCHTPEMMDRMGQPPAQGAEDANPLRDHPKA